MVDQLRSPCGPAQRDSAGPRSPWPETCGCVDDQPFRGMIHLGTPIKEVRIGDAEVTQDALDRTRQFPPYTHSIRNPRDGVLLHHGL